MALAVALFLAAQPAAPEPLSDADPGIRLKAAVTACFGLANDVAATTAAVRAAGWDVTVPEGSGSGLAVFRNGPLLLSLAADGQACSVHAADQSMAAMDTVLREALAATGLSPAPSSDVWTNCQVLDIGSGRRAVVTANTADFTCGTGDQSAVFIYTALP